MLATHEHVEKYKLRGHQYDPERGRYQVDYGFDIEVHNVYCQCNACALYWGEEDYPTWD